jgi:hypothetical protein
VLVGGDYQGGGGVQRAQSTRVDAGASIRADATVGGNGGKVVLWSDGATTAHGSVSARGAARPAAWSRPRAMCSTSTASPSTPPAARRQNGTWLLDPYDIEVVAGGAASANDVRSPPTAQRPA